MPEITYTWSLKYGTDELIYETVTNRRRKQTWLRGEGGGMNWETEIDMYPY